MKTLSVACAVLFALVLYNSAPAGAQTGPTPSAASTLDDFSSARKHRRHVRVYRYYDRHYGYRDHLEANRSFDFVGQYPGEYAWRRTAGQTVCDLGYGRFDACDSR